MEGCGVVRLKSVKWLKLSGSVRPAIVEGAGQRNRGAFGAISRELKATKCEEPLPLIPREGRGKDSNRGRCSFLEGAPLPGPQFTMAPTWRPPKKAKQPSVEVPPPLTRNVDVVGLLKSLGCSEAVLAEVQGRLAPAEPKVRTPGERALKLAEIETALHKAKRHEVKLMEQLEAQERKVRSTKAILN